MHRTNQHHDVMAKHLTECFVDLRSHGLTSQMRSTAEMFAKVGLMK